MKDVLLFVNPIAGKGRGRTIADRVAERLHRDGLRVRAFHSPPAGIADDELIADARVVIAIGGDGTLRGVAQRMLALVNDDAARVPPLLVISLGTANLMARHLSLKWEPRHVAEQVSAAIARGQVVPLDAARANDRLFLLMAGVGLDATVVHELDRVRRGPIDIASYALPLVQSLRTYDFPSLRVQADGKLLADDLPALAFAGNVPEYGTGFPILSQAASNDGLLDLCILPCKRPGDLLRWAMLAVTGDHIRTPGVIYTKARSIRIDSADPVPVQIDGDPAGFTPLSIDLLPAKLRFIVQ